MFPCQCGSTFKSKFSLQRHQSSRVHELNADGPITSNGKSFECPTCSFETAHKGHFREHLRSNRHVRATTPTDPQGSQVVSIEVLEKFMKHQEKMMQMNTDLVKSLVERNTQRFETTNCVVHNKKFNLHLYLNEECKSAMNISEFVKGVAVTMEDLENFGEKGYTEGMTKILSRALRNTDQTERPMQCTDVKRETFYVKKDDTWLKDQDCEETKRLIQHISHKNYKALNEWCTQHPVSDSPDYEAWYSISRNMCNTDPAALNKLVRHLAAMTAVEKQMINKR